MTYLCEQVLPQFDVIGSLERGCLLQMELLKQLAELSVYYQPGEHVNSNLLHIFKALKVIFIFFAKLSPLK